jgi:drug/metabolite transporter (DMT)-like permease
LAPILKVLIGASFLGFAAIFARFASTQASPSEIAFFRMAFSLPVLFLWYKKDLHLKLNRFHFIAISAGVLFSIDLILWHRALTLTSASNATFLVGLAPLWVALFNALLMKERLSVVFWLGLVLSLTGASLLALQSLQYLQFGLGEIYATFASFFYAAFTICFARSRQYCARGETLFWCVLGAMCFSGFSMLFNLPLQIPTYTWQTWSSLISLAVVVQILAWSLISEGLKHVSSSEGSVALLMQQVATLVLGYFILRDSFGAMDGLGSVIILMGMVLSSFRPTKK